MNRRATVPRSNIKGELLRLFILLGLLMPAFPVSAGEIALYFDSSGRPLKSMSGSYDNTGIRKSQPVLPEGNRPLGNVTYQNYPVSGSSFSEIMRSVRDNAPYNDIAGQRLPWKAEWTAGLSYQFSYTYGIDESEGKLHAAIEITGIELTGAGTITLPSLIDDTGLNPVEKDMWERYLSNLVTHCHGIISVVWDRDISKTASDRLGETDYLIFDYAGGMDIDATVEAFLAAEASKAGRERVKAIKEKMAAFEKAASSGASPEKRGLFFNEKGLP